MNQQPPKPTKTKKPISVIDALAKMQRILNELDEGDRKKAIAFLAG